MSKILAYGTVTERKPVPFSNTIEYIINGNSAAFTTNGSLLDRAIHENRTGFFVVDQDGDICDYSPFAQNGYYVDQQKRRASDLKVATKQLVAACSNVKRNDLQLVAGALGAGLGAVMMFSGAAAFFTSVFTGDFTGTLGGAAGTAVGGLVTYISYENLTAAQKNIYNACKKFEAALETYHLICIKYAPQHMQGLPVYEPEFAAISKMLRYVFPNFGEKDLTYNQPNWSVA